MALLKKHAIRSKRLSGSTLIEALTALVIIMLLTGMGFAIYLQVVNSEAVPMKLRAKEQVNRKLFQTLTEEQWYNETTETEEFTIERKVNLYHGNNHLVQVEIAAHTNKGKLLYMKKLLYTVE